MRLSTRHTPLALVCLMAVWSCADQPMALSDGEFDEIPVSLKADGGYTACEYAAALEWINDP